MSEIESRAKLEKRIKVRELWLKSLSVVALLILIAGLGIYIYLQTSYQARIQLENPANVRVEKLGDNVYLKFDKVKNAVAYRYSVDDNVVQVSATDLTIDITALVEKPKKYSISVQALANDGYKNSDAVFAEDYIVTKTLARPVVDLDKYDSKLVWVGVDDADMYEITTIVNNDFSTATTAIVTATEFDISEIVVSFTKEYSFTVKAIAEDEYINQSPASLSVGHSLKGKLDTPTNVAYDETNGSLHWTNVENAETYTVVLSHGNQDPKKIVVNQNFIIFDKADIADIGEYVAYVYANNISADGVDGEVEWFLASEKSEEVTFSIYQKLAMPNELSYQMNSDLIWFSWANVQNAKSYTIELVNEENVAYYQKVTYVNEINLRRDLANAVGGNFRVRIQANGYGYYLTSDFSAILELNALDKFAQVQNIEVLENGKYLTFTASNKNVAGDTKLAPQNGYTLIIQKANGDEVFNETIYETLIDTSAIFVEPIVYKIKIIVNAYSYFSASDEASAEYAHQIMLTAPYNLNFAKFTASENTSLTLQFTADAHSTDYTIWIDGVEFKNVMTNPEYAQFVSLVDGTSSETVQYVLDVSALYQAVYEYEPLKIAKKYSAKVKALGNVTEAQKDQAGYRDSKYSNVVMYENKIRLETPQFVRVDNLEEESVLLYFTRVENATNYLISITGEISGVTSVATSRLTTCDIYDIISAGKNTITITAIGAGYYENSLPSEPAEYDYTPILKAPNDVEVVEEKIEDETHYFAEFTTTRFAQYYKVDIRKTHELNTVDGVKQVVELADATFETLSANYAKGTVKTQCDITDYLTAHGFGKYEIKVRAVLEQPTVPETPFVYSDYSNLVVYGYFDKQPAPTNLQFDKNTNILTFSSVETAVNGYVVKVTLQQNDGTMLSNEIVTSTNTVDLTNVIAGFGGVGAFTMTALTRKVDELFLSNSDWADAINVEIRVKLADPTNFKYNETLQEVSWSSDVKMEYEYLKLTFSNQEITSLTLTEISDHSFNISAVNLRDYIKHYGDGFYKFEVKSYSTKNMVDPSELVTYTYTKYVQLDAPVLISVTDKNNRVEAKFATVENAKTYAVVAKLPTQTTWAKIKTGIDGTGQVNVTVDIKAELASLFGANKYDIAVVAESYDYFLESKESNSLQFELWLTFSAPANLSYEVVDGVYYAIWDAVTYAETYSFAVDNMLVDANVSTNRFDLTSVIGNKETGRFLLGVRVNATGYYYASAYTTYDFYLENTLTAPVISYVPETHRLLIDGQGDGVGYSVYIDYYATETALTNGVPTSHIGVDDVQATNIDLTTTMKITGLGIYVIKVKELGDGLYWMDSDWSNEVTAYYTIKADALVMFNVDKTKNGGQVENRVNATKPEDAIYANALVKYDFYEIESLEADITEGQTPVLTIYKTEVDFLVEGLENAKYYKVVATVLGAYDDPNAYNQYLTGAQKVQALSDFAFYNNSDEKTINISTFGNQLSAPTIVNVEMTDDKNLKVTFNKVLNAETYTLMVERQSKNAVIYNNVIDSENADAVFSENSVEVTFATILDGFVDEYDIYNITIYANEVLDAYNEVAFAQSPNSNLAYSYTIALNAPTIEFTKQLDGTIRVQASNIDFATGYELELTINGFTQTYELGAEGYTLLSGVQYGNYKGRAKAIGDLYHKDSDWGSYVDYLNSMELGGVQAVVIIDNGGEATLATRIYAQWDEVEGAKQYGVKIQKDGTDIGEYQTNKTYFDLINIFSANGYGVYTVWAKTNGDGAFISGESTYTKYDQYKYKGQFEIPANFEVTYDYNNVVYPTTLKYYAKFGEVTGAEEFLITIYYTNDADKTEVASITVSASDCGHANGLLTADITDELSAIAGGVYFATIKVLETSKNLGSAESEAVEFVNYHIYDDPSLHVTQIGNTPFVRVAFSDVDNATNFALFINSVLYEENGEQFAYPSAGFVDVNAKFLNIGSLNTFVLEMAGDLANFYLDTYYACEMANFMFTLQMVEDIVITQDSYTNIPDAVNYNVWLAFKQVDFASAYELWVDNTKVAELPAGQEKYNLSAIFANRMPKDDYKIEIVAIDTVYGLSKSDASKYIFDYTLQFEAPTQLDIANGTGAIIATWVAPSNLIPFSNLATSNGVTLNEQEYTIVVYYVADEEDLLVLNQSGITTRNFDLTDYVNEAGEYRIEVYTSANGAFDKSETCASVKYDVIVTLQAVQNLKITESGESVKLSFDKVAEFGYTYAKQDLYYVIYINGSATVRISHNTAVIGVEISQYLWGGDNSIYVITRDYDEKHYIESPRSAVVEYNYVTAFIAMSNATVFHSDVKNKQFLRFDAFSVNGMTEEEILSLTYTISFYNALEGNSLIASQSNFTATKYDSQTFEIDITSVINNTPGSYKIVAKINAYQKTMVIESKTVNFAMRESKETTITYDHKLRADVLDLSLLVIDTEGKQRINSEGLEMQEMWLSFDVKFAEAYVNQAEEFTYVLYINQREYYLTLPFADNLIDTIVTAQGYMTGGTATTAVSTRVKILSRTESGKRVITLSFSLIELLEADGFNIYMTGAISIKAKSAEQGYYYESPYQTNFLKYDYYLRYMTPTGLELVTRADGLHYIKWDEPVHAHIIDYYSIIDAYNVSITSQGIVGETGVVTDPNKTSGGTHSKNFTPDEIIVEDGYLYYLVENMLFAGHNKISLKCNESPTRFYYESGTITIEKQPYYKQIKTPTFDVQDLAINLSGNDSARKGVEIVITNVDNVADYDEELRQVVNYNIDSIYRLTITGYSESKSNASNPTQSTYMNYNLDFKVGKSGIFEFISGESIYDKVTYSYSSNKGQLHIIWQFAEPGRYTYSVQALGNSSNYTLDSEITYLTHDTCYNAPTLSMTVSVYHEVSGVEQIRSALNLTRISSITVEWQTELSKFYNAEYQLDIAGLFNKGSALTIPTINLKNTTSITFSATENSDIFDQIMKRPANYSFKLKSLEKSAPAYSGASDTIVYYRESDVKEVTYDYRVKINTPSELSVVEIGGKAYIKVAIPQYLIDAKIQNNTHQIKVSYKITQLDASFNLGTSTKALSNSDDSASVLLGEKVTGTNDGYYYIDITGNLYPSKNEIKISFNEIADQNFAQSDEAVFEYNYIITLNTVQSFVATNLYTENGYVAGMVISFQNVQFNKYFAYRLDMVGTQYNSSFRKSLILKVDPSAYVAGSAYNYRNVKCYEVAYGSNSIAGQAVVNNTGLYTRTVASGVYSYSKYTYTPCEASSSYTNMLTFMVLIDGGLPDRYDFTITSLGELTQDGQSNPMLKDLPISVATKSSEASKVFSYILKGTLVPADLKIGTSNGGTFVEATLNAKDKALAYIHNNDNENNSFVYLNYVMGQDVTNLKKYEDGASVVLKATLQDSQAKKYYLYVKDNRNSPTEKIQILELKNGQYQASADGVTVTYDATAKKFVAYVDLLTLNGGVITNNANYQFIVIASNDNIIKNDQNKDELIYDASEVNSESKYANRFDKVVTPTMRYDSSNKRFVVSNFSQIEAIISTQLGKSPYDIVLRITQDNKNERNLEIGSGTIVSSESTTTPYKIGKDLYIPYDYIASRLDENGYAIGSTQLQIYFDVDENGYIWDSDYSNTVTFNYKAYIGFPNFAVTAQEYRGGTYATTGDRKTIYGDYDFSSSYEIAKSIETHYTLNTTDYIQGQNWTIELKISYGSNSAIVEVKPGQNNSLIAFNYRSSSSKGFMATLLGNSPTYGEYSFKMKINAIYDGQGYRVGSNLVEYDSSTYTRKLSMMYKLYAPQFVELVLSEDSSTIKTINITYRTDSILTGLASNCNANYKVYKGTSTKISKSIKLSKDTVNYGSSTELNLKESGTYYASVNVSCSRGTYSDYIVSSVSTESAEVFVPFVPGIKSAHIEVDKQNVVTLTINVGKLTDPSGTTFEKGDLSADYFEFDLELINAYGSSQSTGTVYSGTLTDIQKQLNTDFNKIVENKTTSTFAPGSYYFKIKTTNTPSIDGYTYKASDEFYCNSASTYRTNEQSKLQAKASECVYSVGYQNWDSSNLKVLRTNYSYKGIVSGTQVLAINDGNSGALPFVYYMTLATWTDGSNQWISTADTLGGNNLIVVRSFDWAGAGNMANATYKNAYTTASNDWLQLNLYIRLDATVLQQSYGSLPFKDKKNITDYIKLSNDSTTEWYGNYYNVYEGQNVCKRQRLQPPANVTVSHKSQDVDLSHLNGGDKYYVNWSNQDFNSGYVDKTIVKYYFYFSTNSHGQVSNITKDMGITVADMLIGLGPGVINVAYKIYKNNNFAHSLLNDGAFEVSPDSTSTKHYLSNVDHKEEFKGIGGFFSAKQYRADTDRVWVTLQVRSNTAEYDDSAVIQRDNWNGAQPFKDIPSCTDIPDYET